MEVPTQLFYFDLFYFYYCLRERSLVELLAAFLASFLSIDFALVLGGFHFLLSTLS